MKRRVILYCGVLAALLNVVCGAYGKPVMAADCNPTFLGFQAWYSGLEMDDNCNIDSNVYKDKDGLALLVWTIVLNVMIDFSIAIGILATGFVMYGGYLYIFSQGSSDKVAKGKTTIRNAIIGIVIAVAAGAIIGTIKTILTVK